MRLGNMAKHITKISLILFVVLSISCLPASKPANAYYGSSMYGGLYGMMGGLYGMYGGLYGMMGGLYGMYGGLYGMMGGLYGMYGGLYGMMGGLYGMYGMYGGRGLYGMYGGLYGMYGLGGLGMMGW